MTRHLSWEGDRATHLYFSGLKTGAESVGDEKLDTLTQISFQIVAKILRPFEFSRRPNINLGALPKNALAESDISSAFCQHTLISSFTTFLFIYKN